MCIAIPKKVLAIHKTASGSSVDVDNEGQIERVDTSLVENVSVGDYVLVFRGSALRVVDESEAQKIRRALVCVEQVMRGQSDAKQISEAFLDLSDSSDRLPPHLVSIVGKKVI